MRFPTICLPLLALATLPLATYALHCLSHDHCGSDAVCVSSERGAAPVCMCLLGYRGNGKNCVKSSADLASLSSSVRSGGQNTVVIERCSKYEGRLGGEQRPPTLPHTQPPRRTPPPTTTTTPSPTRRYVGPDSDRFQNINPNLVAQEKLPDPQNEPKLSLQPRPQPGGELGKNVSTPCHLVECDFSNGPCNYQNDYYSEWQLREIEGGTILLSTGDSKTEHYLLSGTFSVEEASFLLFDYFESSYTRGHLSVYSNDLATLIWKASGREPGWTQAVATLPPGQHQVIFAAEKLSGQELVAVTNIRLIGNNGTPAGCY